VRTWREAKPPPASTGGPLGYVGPVAQAIDAEQLVEGRARHIDRDGVADESFLEPVHDALLIDVGADARGVVVDAGDQRLRGHRDIRVDVEIGFSDVGVGCKLDSRDWVCSPGIGGYKVCPSRVMMPATWRARA